MRVKHEFGRHGHGQGKGKAKAKREGCKRQKPSKRENEQVGHAAAEAAGKRCGSEYDTIRYDGTKRDGAALFMQGPPEVSFSLSRFQEKGFLVINNNSPHSLSRTRKGQPTRADGSSVDLFRRRKGKKGKKRKERKEEKNKKSG